MDRIRRASACASSSLSPTSSASADNSTCINPQDTTLSPSAAQALTPPSSDKFPQLSEVAMTAGAAISLVDMDVMHHSPNSSIHDENMGINASAFGVGVGGYVEADKVVELNMTMSAADEEAMKNDFDQPSTIS